MKDKEIGWIGTGVMGYSMCQNLIKAGYKLYINSRTKSKAQKLIESGAIWCETPGDLAKKVEIIGSIVGYPEDVHEIYLGKNGVFNSMRESTVIIDMTTSEPSLAKKLYTEAKKKKVSFLDAPVSGGDLGAREGTLSIMVGGDFDAYEKVLEILKAMGKNISYFGDSGAGSHTKMVNQILIASTMIGVVESLHYAYKCGLDLNKVIDVVGAGAASSWSINNLGRRICSGNFDPGFFIKHFVKDMKIALQEAKNMNLNLPGLALACRFYEEACKNGQADMGTHALYRVFEKISKEFSN